MWLFLIDDVKRKRLTLPSRHNTLPQYATRATRHKFYIFTILNSDAWLLWHAINCMKIAMCERMQSYVSGATGHFPGYDAKTGNNRVQRQRVKSVFPWGEQLSGTGSSWSEILKYLNLFRKLTLNNIHISFTSKFRILFTFTFNCVVG